MGTDSELRMTVGLNGNYYYGDAWDALIGESPSGSDRLSWNLGLGAGVTLVGISAAKIRTQYDMTHGTFDARIEFGITDTFSHGGN